MATWPRPKGSEVQECARELETEFARGTVRRHGLRLPGEVAARFPLDEALRLPHEVDAFPLRERVAKESSMASYGTRRRRPHQLANILAEARKRKVEVSLVLDVIHVLHYLWVIAMAVCDGKAATSLDGILGVSSAPRAPAKLQNDRAMTLIISAEKDLQPERSRTLGRSQRDCRHVAGRGRDTWACRGWTNGRRLSVSSGPLRRISARLLSKRPNGKIPSILIRVARCRAPWPQAWSSRDTSLAALTRTRRPRRC
jgi:hypothetical protein